MREAFGIKKGPCFAHKLPALATVWDWAASERKRRAIWGKTERAGWESEWTYYLCSACSARWLMTNRQIHVVPP